MGIKTVGKTKVGGAGIKIINNEYYINNVNKLFSQY